MGASAVSRPVVRLDHDGGRLAVIRSIFTGDHATGGIGGSGGHDVQSFGQSAGGTGAGGAISTYNCSTVPVVANSTFTGEVATGGSGGTGGTGTPGDGGNANGGAIANNAIPFQSCDDQFTVLNTTIAVNRAVAGTGGSAGTAAGGGVFLGSGILNVANTILSSNIAALGTANCAGPNIPSADHGHNLEFNPINTCGFTGGKNDQFGDPKLDSALRDNGSSPQTLALLTGSAAIGNGDPTICAEVLVSGIDQRGFPRSPTQCAIGAFEPQTGAPSPTITAINPTSGPATGGSRVTITGTGFQSGLTVRFGGPTGPTATIISVSSAQIVLTTPAQAAGTVDVVVTNPDGGTVTRAGVYTYGVINPEPPLRSGPPPSGRPSSAGPHARPGPPPSGGPPPAPAPSPRI